MTKPKPTPPPVSIRPTVDAAEYHLSDLAFVGYDEKTGEATPRYDGSTIEYLRALIRDEVERYMVLYGPGTNEPHGILARRPRPKDQK